jgi:hypothetical protein
MKKCLAIIFCAFMALLQANSLQAQIEEDSLSREKRILDSLFIQEVENPKGKNLPDKVLHAEPLYIDLIRDLGARKGEKEWNVGLGILDNTGNYDEYEALVEYEWAPINRLGLEIELPFSFYKARNGSESTPGSRLNSLKLAAQYTFFVSEKISTSLAVGYLHEFEFTEFRSYGRERFFEGNLYNPFFIAAKRWGNNFHTLLYTGPQVLRYFGEDQAKVNWQINSNFHYMIPGTRNFIGIELNKDVFEERFEMTVRPQMRVGLADNLLVGIVTGIPVNRASERFSSFIRLIYEPRH